MLNTLQYTNLEQNFSQYIGQNSTNIQQNLNFQNLADQSNPKMITTDQAFSHSIQISPIPTIAVPNFSDTPATTNSGMISRI
ncbi:hypothetical protein G9F32_00875 [Acinetobacter sp. 194]|uniref:hypothetical protein n=1 Tax=Acinetobacter shaoyimingii TaxID=2715164 RepID=UPI00140A1C62|nr:hypothetical protein [Acinetobacter shaoyimingii]NHB56591.1 hypothetical protein [Acinetobacter shaoyimingii]